MKSFLDGRVTLYHGDNRDVLRSLPDNSVDSFVTDPPYALVSIVKRFGGANAAPCKEGKSGAYARASKGFMGKQWDTGDTVHAVEFWQEVYRVLKPGGHVAAFNGTRTQHRMVCAIEDAGFEIRDMLAWLYGTGFPKSHDVSKGIDKAAGAERTKIRVDAADLKNPPNLVGGVDSGGDRPWRVEAIERGFHEKDSDEPATAAAQQWQGWGTALKPALEPICLARKPLIGTVAANVLEWGTGAINVDGCRVGMSQEDAVYITKQISGFNNTKSIGGVGSGILGGGKVMDRAESYDASKGRWPANVVHDGSEEVVGLFPVTKSGVAPTAGSRNGDVYGDFEKRSLTNHGSSEGSAARFFYSAKASKTDRAGSKHPTVKPVSLMRWLTRLITPPGGTLVDPFAGSGTTGEAAYLEGFNAILIEREDEYVADITRRLSSLEPANDNTAPGAQAQVAA